MTIQTWFRQPTTIHGLAVVGAAFAGAVQHYFTGDMTLAAGAGAIVYAAVHLATDDHTAHAVETLATDATEAIVAQQVRAALPKLLAEAATVANDFMASRTAPVDPAGGGATGAKTTVAGLLGAILLTVGLAACGETPAQVACQVDAVAVETAVPVAGALGGPDAAAKAQEIATMTAALQAAVATECATLPLPTPAPSPPPPLPLVPTPLAQPAAGQ